MTDLIIVDGVRTAALPATDSSVLRGDGCFEAMRSYGGRLFALDDHLRRMARSAAALDLPAPDIEAITRWCDEIAADLGDGVVRVIMSRGDAIPGGDDTPRYVVVGHGVDANASDFTLATVEAPWHPAGRAWALAGAKTISYAPNLSASRAARSAGAHDALLVSADEVVLEGPTFSIAWVVDGVLETPSLDLLVLDSITRRRVLRLAADLEIRVEEGTFPRGRLNEADEVMVLSTVKEVLGVARIDDQAYATGPITRRLGGAFTAMVRDEVDPFS